MKYTQEFKEKAFNVLRYTPIVHDLLTALREEDHIKLRYCLEDALDDEELYVKDIIDDDGERVVCNSKIHAYKDRLSLYSEFMNKYVEYLDGKFVEEEIHDLL